MLFAILPKFNNKSVFLHILVNVASIEENSVVWLYGQVWRKFTKVFLLIWTNVAKRLKNSLFWLTLDNLNRTSVFFFSFGQCG